MAGWVDVAPAGLATLSYNLCRDLAQICACSDGNHEHCMGYALRVLPVPSEADDQDQGGLSIFGQHCQPFKSFEYMLYICLT